MINVLYEDNHLIVVEKPAGVLSQEDATKDPDMLTILKQYLKEKYHKLGNVYLGLVHRLDRMTSGIMVFAKTSKAASRLSEQIRNHQFEKRYYAVVKGSVPETGELKDYLIKNEMLVKSFVTTKELGKIAILTFQKVKEVDKQSVVRVQLKTGRHHQIRAQFANFGHPIVGDHLYDSLASGDLMLHAYYLSFYHPISKEEMTFTLLPTDEKWQKYVS